MTIRLTEPVKRRLQEAADVSGRSLSEEVEQRLSASLHAGDVYAGMFGSPGSVGIIEGVARLMAAVEQSAPDWRSRPNLSAAVHASLLRFLEIALVEDAGPDHYIPMPQRPRGLLAQSDPEPLPYERERAHEMAEAVARVLSFKSRRPNPEDQLRAVVATLRAKHPEALAQLREAYGEQIDALGSAPGPHEKASSKTKTPKRAQGLEK